MSHPVDELEMIQTTENLLQRKLSRNGKLAYDSGYFSGNFKQTSNRELLSIEQATQAAKEIICEYSKPSAETRKAQGYDNVYRTLKEINEDLDSQKLFSPRTSPEKKFEIKVKSTPVRTMGTPERKLSDRLIVREKVAEKKPPVV